MTSFVVDAIACYPGQAKDPGQRNWRDVERREKVPVRIGMIDGQSAPVSLRVATGEMIRSREEQEAPWPLIDVREYGGHLYAPFRASEADSYAGMLRARKSPWSEAPTDHDGLVQLLIGPKGALAEPAIASYQRVIRDEHVDGLRDLMVQGRQQAIDALHAEASQLLIIDGKLCERVPEPCWLFMPGRFPDLKLVWGDHHEAMLAPENCFRLDQFDQGMERLNSEADRRREVRVLGEAEMPRPEVLRLQPEAETIVRTSIDAVRSWDRDEFMQASPSELLAWATLRDQVRALDPASLEGRDHKSRPGLDATIEQAAPLAEALRQALPAIDALPRREYARLDMSFSPYTHHATRPIIEALDRWDRLELKQNTVLELRC